MGISIGLDWSTFARPVSRREKYNSQALEADALHFSTDIWSSSVVIVGLDARVVRRADRRESVLMRADCAAAFIVPAHRDLRQHPTRRSARLTRCSIPRRGAWCERVAA